MKTAIAFVTVLSLAAVAGTAQDLARLSLDRPSDLGLKIQADSREKAEGSASIRIETPRPTSVCLGQVSDLSVEEATLLYQASVKSDLEGSAFLEMWVRVDGKEYFSRGMNDVVTGKSDWKTIQAPFYLQKGQRADKVTLNLVVNGAGVIWVDNAVLSKNPLP